MSEDTNERWASRAHDRHDQFRTELLKASIESAKEGIRAAFLLNGGACLALPGVLASHPSGEGNGFTDALKAGLLWFALGAFLAALTSGLAYFVNSYYGQSATETELHTDPQYVRATAASEALFRKGQCLNWFAAGTGLAAYIFFLIGVCRISSSL